MCKLKKYLQLKKEGKTTREAYRIVRDIDIGFKKYQNLKQEGKNPIEAYLIMKAEGLNHLSCMKILCNVYHLSPMGAKEVMVCTDTGTTSLSEYQRKHILPALKDAFKQEKKDSTQKKDAPPKQ